jgi:hypothetical protein
MEEYIMAKKKKEEEHVDELKDNRPDEIVLTEGPVTVPTSIGDFVIAPWSFGVYAKVGHLVDNMFSDLEKKGISFELLFHQQAINHYFIHVGIPLEEAIESGVDPDIDPEVAELAVRSFDKEFGDLMRLVAVIAPAAGGIIKATLGLDEEDVNEMQADEVIKLFLVIIAKNEGVLKNVYGLFDTAS